LILSCHAPFPHLRMQALTGKGKHRETCFQEDGIPLDHLQRKHMESATESEDFEEKVSIILVVRSRAESSLTRPAVLHPQPTASGWRTKLRVAAYLPGTGHTR